MIGTIGFLIKSFKKPMDIFDCKILKYFNRTEKFKSPLPVDGSIIVRRAQNECVFDTCFDGF